MSTYQLAPLAKQRSPSYRVLQLGKGGGTPNRDGVLLKRLQLLSLEATLKHNGTQLVLGVGSFNPTEGEKEN